jgi:ABC-2 type transport system permease protein
VRARLDVIGAILAKDLRMFARDRFYTLVSVLGLAVYIAVFWVLPATVDETVGLGVHLPGGEEMLAGAGAAGGTEGFDIRVYGSSAALAAAVEAGEEVAAGLDFPAEFLTAAATGEATTVRVLLTGGAPEALRPALVGGVREIAFAVAGNPAPVTLPEMEEIIVGTDRAGAQVPLRERMRPLLVFFVLMTEMFALAALVAAEISQRTVTAILATPARVGDVLAAKTALGTLLAFSQALLLALATGMLSRDPLVLVIALLLGSLLITGFGLVAGSSGKDFVAIIFWSMVFLIPLAIPAFSALFPGTASGWVRALPTYGLFQAIMGAAAYGQTLAELWPHLLGLAAWCAAIFAVGVAVLGRRVVRV